MHNHEEEVLASFGQLTRKDEFQIITKIVNRKGDLVAIKQPYTQKASKHIANISSTYETLNKYLGPKTNIKIVKPIKTTRNTIEFKYLDGINAEQYVINAIIKRDYKEVIRIFDSIFSMLDILSTQKNTTYRNELGKDFFINKILDIYPSESHLTFPGIIDTNIDNFILVGDYLHLIDYEWVFNEPIPTDYIKTRMLYYFFVMRVEALKFLPNKNNPFYLINLYEIEFLIPKKIYDKYSLFLNKHSLDLFHRADAEFQHYVNNSHQYSKQSSQKLFHTKLVTSPSDTFPDIHFSTSAQLNHLQQHLKDIELERDGLIQDIAMIKSSRSWKIIKKINSIRNRLHLK